MSDLRRRIAALERTAPQCSQVFEDWVNYGDAYTRARVRSGDMDRALVELKRELPLCRVRPLIAFVEEAIAANARKSGKTDGR